MFIIIVILIMYLCFFSVFLICKILEIEKDIDTLYDSYSKELQKTYTINIHKGGVING